VAQVMDEFLADPWFHQPKITDSMRLETRGAMVLAIRSAFSEEPENMSAFFFLLYVALYRISREHADAFMVFAFQGEELISDEAGSLYAMVLSMEHRYAAAAGGTSQLFDVTGGPGSAEATRFTYGKPF